MCRWIHTIECILVVFIAGVGGIKEPQAANERQSNIEINSRILENAPQTKC